MGEEQQRYFLTYPSVHCKMDSYNNDWYEKSNVPKRIYHDAITGKIGCKVNDGNFRACDKCNRKPGLYKRHA